MAFVKDVRFTIYGATIYGAKCVSEQKVKLRPVEYHYLKAGEPEKIYYRCQLCDKLVKLYPKTEEDEKFESFSFKWGTERCPCCGVNIDWWC